MVRLLYSYTPVLKVLLQLRNAHVHAEAKKRVHAMSWFGTLPFLHYVARSQRW